MVGAEPSFNFANYAQQQIVEASFYIASGHALPFKTNTFDVIVSGLALNFIPDPQLALQEMQRVVRQGGAVAAYVWDYAGQMEFLRYFWDAAVTIDPSAVSRHEGHRFPICQSEPLEALWQAANFDDIEVTDLSIPTIFENFDSYWESFTVGNFPAPQYLSALPKSQQNALRETLRNRVPRAQDDSISLIARVWAIQGKCLK